MLPKRITLSKACADTLKLLKSRTGVTPNIVCRMAILMSLEDGASGGLRDCDQGGTTLNAPTLFGDHSLLFECLLREVHGELDPKDCGSIIVSHIETGLDQLRKSKSVLDLVEHAGMAAPA